MTLRKSSDIGDDWQATSSSIYAATQPGMTQVVFCDPLNPDKEPVAKEFNLGELELEDLDCEECPLWTYREVKIWEGGENADPGSIRRFKEDLEDFAVK